METFLKTEFVLSSKLVLRYFRMCQILKDTVRCDTLSWNVESHKYEYFSSLVFIFFSTEGKTHFFIAEYLLSQRFNP